MATTGQSATDLAIRMAAAQGTLTITKHKSERMGNTYYAIEDDRGVIEVQQTIDNVRERLNGLLDAEWGSFGRVLRETFSCLPNSLLNAIEQSHFDALNNGINEVGERYRKWLRTNA